MSPGSSSADADGDDESGELEADRVEADTIGETRPKDPILFLVDGFERLLQKIDALYARYKASPGRVQFGLGVVSFFTFIYFGSVVRRVLESTIVASIASFAGDFVAFPLGIRVILAILALLVFQVAVVNGKLTDIAELVEGKMSDSETASDGGWQTKRVEKSSGGAFSGAAVGAIFGSLFGYTSSIFGGMFLGATIGNLIEEWSVRRRNRSKLKSEIVARLLRDRVFEPEAVETETVRGWFPSDDEPFVTEALEDLLADRESPVVRASNGQVQFTIPSEAVSYLDRNGGHVPSEFEGLDRQH